MLYKQINLSASYASCPIDDSHYALSIDTYVIELDSIFEYVGIKNINKVIDEIRKIKTVQLYKGTINNKTKDFIYYKYFNSALAIAHFSVRKSGNNTNKLKNAIGDLYFKIVSEWHKQYPNLVNSLDLFLM